MTKKILLLGSGELGKEFVIAAQRLGQTVVACDSYAGAPAMQVADACEVFDMLDGDALAAAVAKHRPDIIVPEIEAIRTERLYDFEREGVQVVPSARAVNFTMNRKAIRDLAARELGLKTARYFYAKSYGELCDAAAKIGYPCVVKPLMSSSGKGQSLVKGPEELEHAWHYGCEGSRGDIRELIIEEFIRFDSEITLLTVTQKNGPTLFCPPIGHVQKGGDYRELPVAAHRTGAPGRGAAHGRRRDRVAHRRRTVGRGVLPEPRERRLLLGTLAPSPRHRHGDSGRNAESQRVRAAPARRAGHSDPGNHLRTARRERRRPRRSPARRLRTTRASRAPWPTTRAPTCGSSASPRRASTAAWAWSWATNRSTATWRRCATA